MNGITPSDLAVLSRLMQERGWSSLRLRLNGEEVDLSDRETSSATTASAVFAASTSPAASTMGIGNQVPATDPVPQPARRTAPTPAAPAAEGITVMAPNMGTFYRSPSPGAAPYIEVGQRVEIGDEVCLIEVMKLYTQVRAEVSGTVLEITADDGQLVEYGEPLLIIKPDEGDA